MLFLWISIMWPSSAFLKECKYEIVSLLLLVTKNTNAATLT